MAASAKDSRNVTTPPPPRAATPRSLASAERLTALQERLTALLEGLSTRWLTDTLSVAHARTLMREAVTVEITHLRRSWAPENA